MTGFDAVQLSYDEPQADLLHTRLARVLGAPVKRLHGVRGMRRAYRLTAELVDTEHFLLADGDFAIDETFSTGTVEPLAEGVAMRVWQAANPVNGLIYGYGGLKLIRRTALREMGQAVDVLAALPGRVEFCRHSAGVTQFNQSPFHAWKAGFRECAMLARGSEYGMTDTSAHDRIDAWTASRDGAFASYAAAGARDGLEFARAVGRDPERFEALNDPTWLLQHFATLREQLAVTG
ncbi:hypothetical protein [Streptomyces sp. NPDC046985]|uniref:hypothetical protein n=1 Tax=Streptomyces sp. NPDC046985 TaxID=3155377 RepID=UPI0033C3967B